MNGGNGKARGKLDGYARACHAMQSGVAMMVGTIDCSEATPKHLRTGINAAHCDHSALVKLLIAKGIITDDEYGAAITREMEAEVKRYEKRISDHLGRPVTLA